MMSNFREIFEMHAKKLQELSPEVLAQHRQWMLGQFGRVKCIPGYITMDKRATFASTDPQLGA